MVSAEASSVLEYSRYSPSIPEVACSTHAWYITPVLGFCGDVYSVSHVPDTYVRSPHIFVLSEV